MRAEEPLFLRPPNLVPNELHITNGDAAGGTVLRAVEVPPENLLVYWDALSCGPWVEFENPKEWLAVRREFARTVAFTECFGMPDGSADYRFEPLLDTDKLLQAEIVNLWIGSGLADQLVLVWLVRFFDHIGIDAGKLRVAQFQHVPGADYEVVSLSCLKPETVRELGHAEALESAELDYLRAVWGALVSPDPQALPHLLVDVRDRPLPLLTRSLRALLYRYPDRGTGLNRVDQLLLKNARDEGPSAVRVIGATLGDNWETLDKLSDFYLYHRLRRMGEESLPHKLVELTGPSRAMRDTQVQITGTGADVLDGRANAITLNGIDDWVCGVHFCSETGQVWFRDGETLTGP